MIKFLKYAQRDSAKIATKLCKLLTLRSKLPCFRYYLNQFRDAYRQATIDLMTGQPVSEELLKAVAKEDEDEDGEFVKVTHGAVDEVNPEATAGRTGYTNI